MFEHDSCTRTAAAEAAFFPFLHEDAPPDFIFIVLIDIRLQEEMRVRLWTTSLKSTLGLYSPDG